MSHDRPAMSRRRWLTGAGSAAVGVLIPVSLNATPDDMRQAMANEFGIRPIQPGRVKMDLPALAENGNSVRVSVNVDSPMSDADHVTFIQIFAPANPLPDIARFSLTPLSGRAYVETRVRIAAEQTLVAVAGMNDGSLWSGSASIVVTEAACLDALF